MAYSYCRRYFVAHTVASVSMHILILPVLSFTAVLHNKENVKEPHVRMDKLKHRNRQKVTHCHMQVCDEAGSWTVKCRHSSR